MSENKMRNYNHNLSVKVISTTPEKFAGDFNFFLLLNNCYIERIDYVDTQMTNIVTAIIYYTLISDND